MNADEKEIASETDVVLIGAGIMSATLGVLLKELQPELRIQLFERLDKAAAESSDAWNNAGTGHSAFCELNYTPMAPDGSIDIKRAVNIAEAFEVSKQFWAYLISENKIKVPETFITPIPHMSFVWGAANVDFLRKRHQALTRCHLFAGMEYTENHDVLHQWMQLMMEGRNITEPLAATRMDLGTDVNFGSLTRCHIKCLEQQPNVTTHYSTEVRGLQQLPNGRWQIEVKNLVTGKKTITTTRFVFIGAGGGSILLLEKAGIPEGDGFGGFPVSGQWLVCNNEEIIAQHHGKVYGLAAIGAPPMSVPHLDTRFINGKRSLFFGPYAGFSTKFLKHGSYLDLASSISTDNIIPMISAGFKNLSLTKYLVEQVTQSPEERMAALRAYFPNARSEDWELAIAGQRVQVIKDDPEKGGILEFGTQVINKADGSLAVLLGASPGASTVVSIMLDVLTRCFPKQMESEEWKTKIRQMIPSYGRLMGEDEALCREIRAYTTEVLGLKDPAAG